MKQRKEMPESAPKRQKSRAGKIIGMLVRRFFLVLFAVILLVLSGLILVMNLIFKGPSPAARDVLTMSLLEPSATKWIPGLFLDDETLAGINKF